MGNRKEYDRDIEGVRPKQTRVVSYASAAVCESPRCGVTLGVCDDEPETNRV